MVSGVLCVICAVCGVWYGEGLCVVCVWWGVCVVCAWCVMCGMGMFYVCSVLCVCGGGGGIMVLMARE